MSAYVYLLSHATKPRFKIGKAVDLEQRTKQLGQSQFDWSKCAALEVLSDEAALNLEQILHRTFANWRIAPADILRDGGLPDGHTEWFDSSCRERLDSFLSASQDVFGCKVHSADWVQARLSPDPTNDGVALARKAAAQARQAAIDARREKKLEEHAKALAVETERFTMHLQRYGTLLASLSKLCTFIALTPGQYGGRDLIAEFLPEHEDAANELLDKLHRCSFSYNTLKVRGGIHLFERSNNYQKDDKIVNWSSVTWASSDKDFLSEGLKTLSALAVNIPGWDLPISPEQAQKAVALENEIRKQFYPPSVFTPKTLSL